MDLILDIYILLTKHEGRAGRILARGLDSTGKKDQGPIFFQYGPEHAGLANKRFITRLNCLEEKPK